MSFLYYMKNNKRSEYRNLHCIKQIWITTLKPAKGGADHLA